MSLRTSLTSLGLKIFSCQWNTVLATTMSSSSTSAPVAAASSASGSSCSSCSRSGRGARPKAIEPRPSLRVPLGFSEAASRTRRSPRVPRFRSVTSSCMFSIGSASR